MVEIIEPDITEEENLRNLDLVQAVIEKIARASLEEKEKKEA